MKLYVGDSTLRTIYALGLTLCIWIVAAWVGWRWGGMAVVGACFLAMFLTGVALLVSVALAELTREIVNEWEE